MNTPEGQKLAELLMQYGCALKMHDAEHVAGKILELLQFDTLVSVRELDKTIEVLNAIRDYSAGHEAIFADVCAESARLEALQKGVAK